MEHTWHSPILGQEMTVGRYGHAGKPILVFSCQDGRHVEYRDFGMLDVLKPHLEAGKIQLFTTDIWDGRSCTNTHLHPRERALQAERYDRYVMEEMRSRGAALGGEQSGHVILEDHLSGDGLRTAVRLADVLAETGSELRMLRKETLEATGEPEATRENEPEAPPVANDDAPALPAAAPQNEPEPPADPAPPELWTVGGVPLLDAWGRPRRHPLAVARRE